MVIADAPLVELARAHAPQALVIEADGPAGGLRAPASAPGPGAEGKSVDGRTTHSRRRQSGSCNCLRNARTISNGRSNGSVTG